MANLLLFLELCKLFFIFCIKKSPEGLFSDIFIARESFSYAIDRRRKS